MVNIWQSCKQERGYLMHFVHLANTLLTDEESARDSHVLLVTSRFINKPFLFWLVKSPPHLKYAATLPCNLSLMACFADSNVSQGSVATYARCVGVFNMHLTGNLPRNLPVKKFCKWLTFDRIVVLSLWPHFLAHSVVTYKENKIELGLLKID